MSDYDKAWYASKSIWLGLLTFALSVLGFAQGQEFIQQWPAVVTVIGAIVGVLTILLRFVTAAPIRKE